jgi:hypothetical protein
MHPLRGFIEDLLAGEVFALSIAISSVGEVGGTAGEASQASQAGRK